jgi:hypothetical protein
LQTQLSKAAVVEIRTAERQVEPRDTWRAESGFGEKAG